MAVPQAEQFVFLVITWGEDGAEREPFGPYVAQPDGSHLEEIEDVAKRWRADHPDRPGMTAHLFATRAVPAGEVPGDCPAVP